MVVVVFMFTVFIRSNIKTQGNKMKRRGKSTCKYDIDLVAVRKDCCNITRSCSRVLCCSWRAWFCVDDQLYTGFLSCCNIMLCICFASVDWRFPPPQKLPKQAFPYISSVAYTNILQIKASSVQPQSFYIPFYLLNIFALIVI